MTLNSCLWIILGGALGTFGRYFISVIALPISRQMPWGTILINVAGSFIIGFVGTLTLASGRFPISENMRLFIMVGFCGGFTTFSSFSLQTLDLLRSGAITRAAMNVVVSVVLCVGAVALGHVIAAQFNAGATAIAQITLEEEA